MNQSSNNEQTNHKKLGEQHQLAQRAQPIYLHQCGFHSAMGKDIDVIHQILQQGFNPLMKVDNSWLREHKSTVVGQVQTPLPNLLELTELPTTSIFTLPLSTDEISRYNSRNNHLALSALHSMSSTIEAAIQQYGAHRIAIVVGSSTSGIADGENARIHKIKQGGFEKSYHYSQQEPGNCADFLAHYFGISGPCYTISTACSSSGRVFLTAKRLLNARLVDVVIAGGVDTLCHLTINGFDSLEALSSTICRPFSADRDGINIGEAAAFMLMSTNSLLISSPSESPSTITHQKVVLLGAGDSSDAYHISAPHPDGVGAQQAMQKALDSAHLTAEDIGYINAHGTATPLNDSMESKAIYALFGDKVPVSSTKPLTGHTLGAASAVEAAICWHILQYDLILPWHNHTLPYPLLSNEEDKQMALRNRHDSPYSQLADININLLTKPIKLKQKTILSNSFAFGGNNISLIFGLSDE